MIIKGKNEFGNIIPVNIKNIKKVSLNITFPIFSITLHSNKVLYLSNIDNPTALLKFTGMPLRKRKFVGRFNKNGKCKVKKSYENLRNLQSSPALTEEELSELGRLAEDLI